MDRMGYGGKGKMGGRGKFHRLMMVMVKKRQGVKVSGRKMGGR